MRKIERIKTLQHLVDVADYFIGEVHDHVLLLGEKQVLDSVFDFRHTVRQQLKGLKLEREKEHE